MALARFGGGLIQLLGSVAGNTFARNRYGNYVRPRTKPVNPKSDRQSQARQIIQQLTDYWSSGEMSDAERAAWGTYAAAVAMKNRLGESIFLTGFNHFVRSNAARMAVGGSIIEAGPTELSLPGSDPTFAVTADAGTGLLTVAFDDGQDWAGESGAFLSVSMGRPQIDTRNYFGGPFRNAGGLIGSTGVPLTSPQTLVAPFTLVTGQKVWAFARLIRADGRASNPFFAPALIVGGLLGLYNISGSTSPDFDCDIVLGGAFNGKAYFKNTEQPACLWWDGISKWIMSTALGVTGTDYQSLETASPVGTYSLQGEATGAATVAAGSGA
jgi:hypothetical protein